ncbi:hypothetical protein SCALIN_C17_0037 [Candidatus Scalindua japonica]|uniref:DUF456 domain-containing protein n=1 Tax=Candidatus Scalindua japonica TaxID=1284222 RepID=A0A286TYQ8_9BACT|nr:DUF456 domain-containing protein [Candidatus Scalindua japonica]GAX61004.1 hypothetical protein SCALIN_C17_0037 [Candidatus Scalindua japonica]
MDILHITILTLSLMIMFGGLAGIVLPIIPSTPLIWVGVLIYAVCDGFKSISWSLVLIFGVLTILSVILDYFGGVIGAKKYGATKWGLIGSVIGGIAGFFMGGIIGLVFGPFFGAVLFELIFGKDFRSSLKSGIGTLVGFLGGAIAKLVIGVIIIGIFIWKVF